MKPPAANRVPRHIAIIMDGNGRWAQQRGWPRARGHEAGAESVRAVVRACREAGIKYLTLYAFSVENWVRPREEISGLMRLLRVFLDKNEQELHEHRIRLRVIGRLADLPAIIQKRLKRVMEATRDYESGTLVLALSYGGRSELVDATRAIAREAVEGKIRPEDITDATIAAHLYAPDVPDPDLMVRTSGEMRLSNFLLWQLSYAELYVTDVLWPDFREPDLRKAIEAYAGRHRRYGGLA
jgi:undecaprenyl diphosphate synthase